MGKKRKHSNNPLIVDKARLEEVVQGAFASVQEAQRQVESVAKRQRGLDGRETPTTGYPPELGLTVERLETPLTPDHISSFVAWVLSDMTSVEASVPNFVSVRFKASVDRVVVVQIPALTSWAAHRMELLATKRIRPGSHPDSTTSAPLASSHSSHPPTTVKGPLFPPNRLVRDVLAESAAMAAAASTDKLVLPGAVLTPDDQAHRAEGAPVYAPFKGRVRGVHPTYSFPYYGSEVDDDCALLTVPFQKSKSKPLHAKSFGTPLAEAYAAAVRAVTDKEPSFGPLDALGPFLMSKHELVRDSYPVVVSDGDYATALEADLNVGELFGIDCEMVVTTKGRELARITVVDASLAQVLDEYVLPEGDVVDYVTKFSGITAEILESKAKFRLPQIHDLLQQVIGRRSVLVGHSLNFDLEAMRFVHPFVVDTAVLYSTRLGKSRKSKLSYLSQTYLDRVIQNSAHGHDSHEDAAATMELALLFIAHHLQSRRLMDRGLGVYLRNQGVRSRFLLSHCAPRVHRQPCVFHDLRHGRSGESSRRFLAAMGLPAQLLPDDAAVMAAALEELANPSKRVAQAAVKFADSGARYLYCQLNALRSLYQEHGAESRFPTANIAATLDRLVPTQALDPVLLTIHAHLESLLDALPDRSFLVVIAGPFLETTAPIPSCFSITLKESASSTMPL